MDVIEHLETITNLNQYMQVTQNVSSNFPNIKIELNMSTIQALQKAKSFEIEHFNKYEESGAAIKVFGLLLHNPPSKIWGLLGRDLVVLLQYWLNALRKHLIIHNNYWWSFLQTLLDFIKELGLKENKLYDMLMKETAECLLDLATHYKPDLSQRYKILCCLNSCGIACSRETRIALRAHFNIYFIKLATFLSSCGDMATQYSIMETLIRWLLPRYVQDVRMKAAAKWFPNNLFHKDAVTLFVERPWKDFFQDTRDFLNAHNARGDLVTSVVCRKLTIGQIAVITGLEKSNNWLDINTSTKCLSVMLESKALKLLGCSLATDECEALIVSETNIDTAKLRKVDSAVTISVRTLEPAHVIPSEIQLVGEDCRSLSIVISTKSDMRKVDNALRKIFADKYQVLFDIEHGIALSPPGHDAAYSRVSDEDTKFSMPSAPVRRKHTGYIIKSRTIGPQQLTSTTTTSTSSLAQLHNKLAELPRYSYKLRDDYKVCQTPQLSEIVEASDLEVGTSFSSDTSSFQFKKFGVRQESSPPESGQHAVDQGREKDEQTERVSPVLRNDSNSVSCLFVATIGTADESVINATLERMPKGKDCDPGNIIDLLVQEAFEAKSRDKPIDTITTSRDIDNVKPVSNVATHEERAGKIKSCTIISNSTSTDDIVEGTQFSRTGFEKRNVKKKPTEPEMSPVKNFQDKVEDFFSEHICANINKEAVSPSLARRHNETDSEPSEADRPREQDEENQQSNGDSDVEECLKFLIDTVCNELNYLDEDLQETLNVIHEVAACQENNLKETADNLNTEKLTEDLGDFKSPTTSSRSIRNITLKFKNVKRKTQRKQIKVNYNNKSPAVKKNKTTDIRKEDVPSNSEVCNPTDDDKVTKRSVRNKRKLYSLKNDAFNDNIVEKNESQDSSKESKIKTYANTKSNITSYKEIEKERNEYRKKLRNKQPRKSEEVCLSPKTKKMNDVFDKLRSDIDTNRNVKLADTASTSNNVAIYNFTSDSEDDNFKLSALKHVTPKSKLHTLSEQSKKKNTRSKNKNVKPTKIKVAFKPSPILVDEKMREAPPDTLDTSFEIEKQTRQVIQEPLLDKEKEHEMEMIEESQVRVKRNKTANKRVNNKPDKKKKSPAKNKKRSKKINKSIIINETLNTSLSPLPGLLVEAVPKHKNAEDVSASPRRLQEIKEIYVKSPEKFETRENLLMDLDQTSECGQTGDHHNLLDNSQSSRVLRSQTKLTPTEKVIIEKRFSSKEPLRETTKTRAEVDSTRNVINISGDSNSERSINTVGFLPITAHGDFNRCCDDLPPSQDVLTETIEPRNLEIEEQDQSVKDLHVQLNTDILDDQSVQSWRKSFRNDNVAKERNAPFVSITKLSDDVIRWLPSPRDSDVGSNSNAGSLDKPKSTVCNASFERPKQILKKSEIVDKNMSRNTQISPIRSFNEPTMYQLRGSCSSDSDGGEQKNLFYIKRNKENTKTNLRRRRTESSCSKKSSNSDQAVKRKSCEMPDGFKKRKIENINSASTEHGSSDCSSSYVNTWMEKWAPATSRGINHGFEDIVKNLYEKLDTTLDEIHRNTDKRFIKTVVETQKKLNDLKRRQQEILEETRRDFEHRIERFHEMTDEILSYVKSDIRTIIKEDSKQKRAMVRILKEDVQAVIDYNNQRRRSK